MANSLSLGKLLSAHTYGFRPGFPKSPSLILDSSTRRWNLGLQTHIGKLASARGGTRLVPTQVFFRFFLPYALMNY